MPSQIEGDGFLSVNRVTAHLTGVGYLMKKLAAVLFSVFVCLPAGWSAGMIPGSAERGSALFKEKQCVGCHKIQGTGGNLAPDLASHPSGRFTPAVLATAIWNHGPNMWAAMEKSGMEKPSLSPQEAADLFAYLYSFRYFEEPGDAGRGKQAFDSKGCIACHSQGIAGAPPIMEWESLNDPIELARSMWNHAPVMEKAMPAGGTWPTLTAQQMTDLVVYVRNSRGAPKAPTKLAAASADTGENLFYAKGCIGCHIGTQALSGTTGARTLTELATAMWNHAPEMRGKSQELRPEEMSRIVGYLWSVQYFEGEGDALKGLEIAATNGCIECHGDPQGSTPRFSAFSGQMDPIRFISGTWSHGIGMQAAMKDAAKSWPELDNTSILDLIAYINSL
jgi:mono/diheme cytochrome c family protein